jgi:lipid II:glycine glycyltransferase (peptidoglycan interpeptide bridge formation enzyme)
LYHRRHVVYWHGVTDPSYAHCHPVHVLLATAIEDACGRGLRWFDFNPSGGLDGVEQFKSGFGAKRIEFRAFRNLSPFGRSYRLYRHCKERYLRTCSI